MASKQPTCRRCMKPTPATEEIEFSAYGIPYKIWLCAEHARTFEEDIDYWIRLADELMPVAVPREPNRALSAKVDTARLREAVRIAEEDARTTLEAQRRLAEIEADLQVTDGWHLSSRAEEQADLLGIGLDKVMLCAMHPDPRRIQHTASGADIHFSADCRVVVDQEAREIVDVWLLVDGVTGATNTPERIAS